MAENTEQKDIKIPELVLETEQDTIIPTLELAEEDVRATEAALEKTASATPAPPRDLEIELSPEELKVVEDFASKIDITNSTQILQYGAGAQQKMSTFSESALQSVRSKDMDQVGDMISNLVIELRNFSPAKEEEKGGFLGFFRKQKSSMDKMIAKYDTIDGNIEKIVVELENHKVTLLRDITMLDKLYDQNLEYYKELTMYIIAGRKRLEEAEKVDLVALRNKAEETGKPEDAQKANDFAAMCNRFDKKLHDLELTRNISIQMGPQIRLVQANDTMMVEKIHSSIVNTIPLWKNQMVLSLGLVHSKDAIEAQRKVTNITNELLRQNADTLKTSTIEAAKESERGIIDIETLQHTNQALISTLDEVLEIQQQGREQRRQAEGELQRIENELKGKLLEIRDVSGNPVTPTTQNPSNTSQN